MKKEWNTIQACTVILISLFFQHFDLRCDYNQEIKDIIMTIKSNQF